ncbi:MAG: hypothetical protein WDN26_18180 [Chitinophagaceae bacterium]
MKKTTVVLSILASLAFTGCSEGSKKADHQNSPEAVAETIFKAAKTGDYEALPAIVDKDADSDSKRIAAVASDPAAQAEFKKYFEKGKLNGEPMIEGDKASVKILFGPEGDREETFEMVKRDGHWYLKSF